MLCPYCLQRVTFQKKNLPDNSLLITCPKCSETIPVRFEQDYDSFTPIIFGVVGFRSHGKSVYLASLLNEFERLTRVRQGFSYTPLDESGLKIVREKQQLLKQGRLPDATPGNVLAKPVILQLEGMEELSGFRLLTYDIAGDVFRRGSELKQYAGYVVRGHSVVWLISLEDLETPQELTDLIGRYVQAVLELNGQPKDQTLLIVLTKGDGLLERSDIPQTLRDFLKGERPRPGEVPVRFADELSDVIEKWLEGRAGYQNFVRRVRKEFEQVKYCAVSATGSQPVGQSMAMSLVPRGVLEPLLWLLRIERARQDLHNDLLMLERKFSNRKNLIDRYLEKTASPRLEKAISSAKEAVEVASMRQAEEKVQSVQSNLTDLLRRINLLRGRRYVLASLFATLVFAVVGWLGWKRYLGWQRKQARYIRENLADLMLDGGLIELPAGDYHLSRFVQMVKTVSLKGSGRDTTRIICGDRNLGLLFASEGTFAASDITFEYSGTQPANVLTIRSGNIDLQRCRFANGIADKSQPDLGHGLHLRGKVTGTISECEFVRNGQHGVAVNDSAQVTITGCSMRDNQYAGISYASSGSGTLRNSDCSNNQSLGIQVGEQANPLLDGNTCRNNRRSGIGYSGNAAGAAQNNQCLNNGLNGITIEDFAQPSLEINNCHENERSGIAYANNGSGTARQNQCLNNAWHGMVVTNNAQPTLDENQSRDNGKSGITYAEDAGGRASNNECAKNRMHGFSIEGRARPKLENNKSEENQACGISYSSHSAGTATGNNVANNSSHGIIVGNQAQPELDSNHCEKNKASGIAYSGQAAGIARKNECTTNADYGILVAKDANPTLEENVYTNNGAGDVVDWRTVIENIEPDRPRLVAPPLPD